MYRYILIVALVVFSTPLCGEEMPKAMEEAIREIYKRGESLPFKMKVPEGFVLMPLKRDGEWGLMEWSAYGEESTIVDLWEQIDKDPECTLKPRTGIIRMRLSDFAQKNEKEFSESDQEMIQNVKVTGAKDIQIRSLQWGPYPLKVIKATLPNGKPLAMGWIGLNAGGETILIHYMFPDNQNSYVKDLEIWEKFLTESTGIPPKEFMEKMDKMFEDLRLLK
jgi:hypothetical protein